MARSHSARRPTPLSLARQMIREGRSIPATLTAQLEALGVNVAALTERLAA